MAVKRRKMKLIPPTYEERLQEAQNAYDAASQNYIAAVTGGNAEAIRLARRQVLITQANYLLVMADEPEN